ncbi:MAG: heavy metal translocating P-type ATPase [Dehalococcoidia bacterium]
MTASPHHTVHGDHGDHGTVAEAFHAGLACVACAEAVERDLRANAHITAVHVDYAAKTVHVSYHAGMISREAIQALISGAAHGCRCGPTGGGSEAVGGGVRDSAHHAQMAPITMNTAADRMQYEMPATAAGKLHRSEHAAMDHGAMGHDMSDPRMAKAMEADMRNRFFVALLLTVPTILFSPLAMNTFGIEITQLSRANWLALAFSTPVVWWAGWPFIAGAVTSLRYRQLNMSVLIATGVLAAWGFSVLITLTNQGETFYEAATMLVTFVLFGHWMEMKSRRGTTDALRALFDLVPPTATVIRDGVEREVPTSELVAGDRIRLRPGDKVPVDGVVVEGSTSIDESLVTGESVPVEKQPGDGVIGGSINRAGSVVMQATKVGSETALAQIVALVQQAQSSKAPGQRLADRAAAYLVVVAVGSGVVTFLTWYLLGEESALVALTFAISAVVIACPDALGLATPTAVAVGTGVGAKHNILIKDAATLEGVSAIDVVVLDTTGPLTEGRPSLTDVALSPQSSILSGDGQAQDPGLSAPDMLQLVASAEQGSEHPLAEAIVRDATDKGLALQTATDFTAIPGKGLRARVDGREVLAGNAALLEDAGIDPGALRERADQLAADGKTPMYVAVDGTAVGLVAVADTVRPSARRLIPLLNDAGIEVAMMTGDNRRTAEAVANELGITRVFAEVLPDQKADYVRQLQAEGKRVAMVGDGVNDAPALAQADIGIAIGAGTDVAIETAKVVLMKSDPLDIMRAWRLSKATVRTMKQNLFWASIYNVLAIPIAAGVLFPRFGIMLRPEWSALLMSLSSIIVATNAVLLKRVDGELTRVGEESAA